MPTPARFRSTIASIVLQPEDLRELRTFHKALADVNRLRIVRRLAEGEASVAQLIAHVGLSQPLVSHHLKRLRVAGPGRRPGGSGRETICTPPPGGLRRGGRARARDPRASRVDDLQPDPATRIKAVFEPIALAHGPRSASRPMP